MSTTSSTVPVAGIGFGEIMIILVMLCIMLVAVAGFFGLIYLLIRALQKPQCPRRQLSRRSSSRSSRNVTANT
jgi:hypothetical protein